MNESILQPHTVPTESRSRSNPRSLMLIVFVWFVLQIGGLFSPGLLDDVDSIYVEIAREMLHRHDFVTPYIDGVRFFDKPPLMYWLAAGSMRLFGEHDWAARLPLALAVLALLLSVYALGLRLFQSISPVRHPDRGALYATLVLATSIGLYLYTRFFIPDILLALWMTLSVHLFLIALARASLDSPPIRVPHVSLLRRGWTTTIHNGSPIKQTYQTYRPSSLLPCLAFATILALNLLTKGLIGLVFPLAFVFLYLLLTRQLRLISKLHLFPSALVFAAIALPWHLLAALRNPAIALPPGLGLPVRGGWAWFYLYNEHFARFLGKRIPHDYGQTPVWLFWFYALLWMMPWAAFLPATLSSLARIQLPQVQRLRPAFNLSRPEHQATLALTLWALIVLIFFSLSSRQEYYSLPALPALALIIGGLLARADTSPSTQRPGAPSFELHPKGGVSSKARPHSIANPIPSQWILACHRWLLLPLATLVTCVCAFLAITAPRPTPGVELASLLATNPALYNLSLGHLFDLTAGAMGYFRGPLLAVALGMTAIGLVSYLLRRLQRAFAANLAIVAGMIVVLLAAHEGLARFNPILGSKGLAQAILREQQQHPQQADLILLDGELSSGSTLLFYTRQPVHLVNGRVNGPWFGSFWPDAPHIFESEPSLRTLWQSPNRIFLQTPNPAARTLDLALYGPVRILTTAGGKTILTNQ